MKRVTARFWVLAKMAFVRTRAGTFARPDEVYIWSAALETILGTVAERWVEEAWIPASVQSRSCDLFDRLGMPLAAAAEHIVNRIEVIAEVDELDAIVAGTTPIIRHVLYRWTRFTEEARLELSRLKEVKFLSAIIDGSAIRDLDTPRVRSTGQVVLPASRQRCR